MNERESTKLPTPGSNIHQYWMCVLICFALFVVSDIKMKCILWNCLLKLYSITWIASMIINFHINPGHLFQLCTTPDSVSQIIIKYIWQFYSIGFGSLLSSFLSSIKCFSQVILASSESYLMHTHWIVPPPYLPSPIKCIPFNPSRARHSSSSIQLELLPKP